MNYEQAYRGGSSMRKIGTVGLFVTFALVLHLLGALALASGTINVYVGQTTTFSVNYRVAKLAIGDPQVADYIVEKNKKSGAEILINGKRPGSTNLIVWNQAGQQIDQLTINVLVKDLDNYMKQIQGMIGDVDGLNFRTAGGKLIIEGEVSLPRDVQRIKKVVGDSPQVMNLVTISPVSLNLIAKTIDEGINTPGIKVSTVGQKIILEGVVYSKEEKERIEKKARLYYWGVENLIETKKSDLDPGYGETIQVTAHFMEVSKNAIRGWGIKWAPGSVATVSGSQDLAGGGFAGAITGLITNLFPKYRKANERSEARILETSSLSVRSGDAADFLSGGEMGIQSINSAGVGQTTFKEYGIKVNVTPHRPRTECFPKDQGRGQRTHHGVGRRSNQFP